jgi:hypothetical protein
MKWEHKMSPVKKFEPQTKVEIVILQDSKEPIFEHNQERGEMINIARYSEFLRDKLKPRTTVKSCVVCMTPCCCAHS